MIAGQDLDRRPEHAAAEILGRHFRGGHRSRPRDIGIGAGLVIEHADAQHAVADLRAGGLDRRRDQCHRGEHHRQRAAADSA